MTRKKKECWDVINSTKRGKLIAFYAYDLKNYKAAKYALDMMQAFIGKDNPVPFTEDEKTKPSSQVEKLASTDYKIRICFNRGLKLEQKLIIGINEAVRSPYSIEGDTIPNPGSVRLTAETYKYGIKEVNAKNITQILTLEGKKVSALDFAFRGGYVRQTAYAALVSLGKIKLEKREI